MQANAARFIYSALLTIAVGAFAAVPALAQYNPPVEPCPVGGHSVISCPVINDQVILDSVRIRLAGIVTIPENCVSVGVANGVVTLTGQVDSEARRDIAVLLASSVRGVRGVNNQLVVSPTTLQDHDLLVAVSKAVRKAPINPRFININVSKGVVRLTGMVDNEYDRDQAGAFAAGVPGVVEVQNNLVIRNIGITP